jgi:catechol 2,3-dioxygenase-like lactoylglutathione lyase family enzyme
VEILGLAFLATVTPDREEQAAFFRDVLGLTPVRIEEVDADFFHLPDGSGAAVYPGEPGDERSVGFLVAEIESSLAELRRAGIDTEEVVAAGPWLYAHFWAPDGKRYELVQKRSS